MNDHADFEDHPETEIFTCNTDMDTRSSARNKAVSSNALAQVASRTTKTKVTAKSTVLTKPAPAGVKRAPIPRKPLSSRSNSSFVSDGSSKPKSKNPPTYKDTKTPGAQGEDREPITVRRFSI